MKTIKDNQSTIFLRVVTILFFIFFNGCALVNQMEMDTPPQPEIINSAFPFTDVPVPSGFSRDQLKSFIYETGDDSVKVGRLFFNGSLSLKQTVEFYQNEMINKGWALANSMASTDTILNYQKEGWMCTVIIRPRSFSRSVIEVQIGPVHMGAK